MALCKNRQRLKQILWNPVTRLSTAIYSAPISISYHRYMSNTSDTQKITDYRLVYTEDVFTQLVNTIMKDGKKSIAERQVVDAFEEIRKMLKSNPTLVQTLQTSDQSDGGMVLDKTDPHELFRKAILLASPLVRIKTIKKSSKNEQVPIPLNERQQRRRSIVWILDASAQHKDKDFSKRLASEVIAVCSGTSTVFQQKDTLHKAAVALRANASVRL